MVQGESNGHVNDDVTWLQKVKLVTPIRLKRNISKTAGDAIQQRSLITTCTCTQSVCCDAVTVGYPSNSLVSCLLTARPHAKQCRSDNAIMLQQFSISVRPSFIRSLYFGIVSKRLNASYKFYAASKRRHTNFLRISRRYDAHARGNPLEFLDEAYPAKTRVMGLPYGKNFIIPTSTVFVGFTDRQTDGRADGRATGIFNVPSHCLGFAVQSWDFQRATAYSIYAQRAMLSPVRLPDRPSVRP